VKNPFAEEATAVAELVAPDGWTVSPEQQEVLLGASAEDEVVFRVRPDAPVRRARVAVDLTVGETPFGQQAEALVDVG
jgi:hypothetical protein